MTYLLRRVFQCIQRDGRCPPHLVMGVCQETVEGHKDTLRYILQSTARHFFQLNAWSTTRPGQEAILISHVMFRAVKMQPAQMGTYREENAHQENVTKTPGKCYQMAGLVPVSVHCMVKKYSTQAEQKESCPALHFLR